MAELRRNFHAELARLEQDTLGALDFVDAAIERTARAVREQDRQQATAIVSADDELDRAYLAVKQGLLGLLATQTPVAGELRLVAALLTVIGHAERMGDHCVNIAKRVPFGGAPPEGPEAMLEPLERMAGIARSMTAQARDSLRERDLPGAEALVRRDTELNALNRECFGLAVRSGEDVATHEWTMQMMLTARWYERIGDHAVDIGEETAFVVTGEFREFTDASHPGGVQL
jgi:phosphate transport system protein